MYLYLRERESDALLVELRIDSLVRVEEDIPVIGGFCPNSKNEVHTTVRQFFHGDERSRVLHDALILLQELQRYLLNLFSLSAILHTYREIHSPQIILRIVCDVAARECSIWDEKLLVVGRGQYCVEDLDGLHDAAHALSLDEIAHFEGFQEEENDAASQVLQVAAQGHTDCQTS